MKALMLNLHPDVCHPLSHWDTTWLQESFARAGVELVEGKVPVDDSGVIVIPGAFHVDDLVQINFILAGRTRVFVIVVSDEGSLFPYEQLVHPDMTLWVMTPRPGRGPADRCLGESWQPGTRETLSLFHDAGERGLSWSFAGQTNHVRRRQMTQATGQLSGVLARDVNGWAPSPGFTQGLGQNEYLSMLRQSKLVLAPSGPVTPDSFRFYEALEAGALPVTDAYCSGYGMAGYWECLFGETPPVPLVHDWANLDGLLVEALADWPANANRAFAWWQRRKRDDSRALLAELSRLDGVDRTGLITVLVSTSPIPSHPETKIIEETVGSVRERLPNAEIIVMVDGVHGGQEHYRDRYNEYVRRLLWLCNHQWGDTYPVLSDVHRHQAGMTRMALSHVDTPYVLFVEHDTPLEGDLPFSDLVAPLAEGQIDVLRFHHESEVLGVHRHLMVDQGPVVLSGVPLWRTRQWSQRPHLARTAYYRRIAASHFGEQARTFIEDVLHGVITAEWKRDRGGAWFEHRLAIYTPEGNIRRSYHIDGRGTDPKMLQQFAYDTVETPWGAPAPGTR